MQSNYSKYCTISYASIANVDRQAGILAGNILCLLVVGCNLCQQSFVRADIIYKLQVVGSAHFPAPSVSYSPEHGGQRLSLGDGVYEMRVDQLNPCIRF